MTDMPARRSKAPTRSLFDAHYQGFGGVLSQLPYAWAVRALSESPKGALFDENELAIFNQCLEHEAGLYEPRGWIIGPLVWRGPRGRIADLRRARQPKRIPGYVEQGAVELLECQADGVMVIEDEVTFCSLARRKAWAETNMIMVTGCGLPRYAVRRLLCRLATEFKQPVYLVADNDTWGYFVFSLLKRGAIAPHESSPFGGVDDVRYLGIRAGEFIDATTTRPWEEIWGVRTRHLRQYPCFSTTEWQREFDRFEEHRRATRLRGVCESKGEGWFASAYLREKLNRAEWLS